MNGMNSTQDHEIIKYLERIEIKPTNRFYQLIENKPWMSTTYQEATNQTWGSSLLHMPIVMASVVVILLSLLLFQMPPLRLLAQQLLSRFVHQPTDTIASTELFNGNGEYMNWFGDQSKAIEQAEQVTNFEIAVPTMLPEGYFFKQTLYPSAEKVILSYYLYSTKPYTDALFENAPSLILSQQALAYADQSPLLVKIGASAGVEVVSLNGQQGEYVQGGWTNQSSEDPTVRWRWLACCRMLRWQTDEYVFTLITHNYPDSPGFIGREELIKIASGVTIPKE